MASRGFTLIEMLVVVLIVGILASAAMPLAELTQRRAKEAELRANLRTLRTAIDDYKKAWDDNRIEHQMQDTGYPPDLDTLVKGVVDAKSAKSSKRIYFLRRIPRDPFADPLLPAARTWGLRSYDSPPDAPQRGADVYDVYSTATGEGLDGVPYRQW
ncbi:type II secretion system protein [Aquabacterium sp.]|uniref:type II secretion system protein n=1 Tax=Aquabacterium sp. TaxID=1872578 RepID=UPI0035B33F08